MKPFSLAVALSLAIVAAPSVLADGDGGSPWEETVVSPPREDPDAVVVGDLPGSVASPTPINHCLIYATPNGVPECWLRIVVCQSALDCAYVCVFENNLDNACWGPGADKWPKLVVGSSPPDDALCSPWIEGFELCYCPLSSDAVCVQVCTMTSTIGCRGATVALERHGAFGGSVA